MAKRWTWEERAEVICVIAGDMRKCGEQNCQYTLLPGTNICPNILIDDADELERMIQNPGKYPHQDKDKIVKIAELLIAVGKRYWDIAPFPGTNLTPHRFEDWGNRIKVLILDDFLTLNRFQDELIHGNPAKYQ